ncbi:MAG TPA: VWA domain-containing protein [Pyrinomonadaceae bacterium]|nr:VWA domain-containing protein [Pyrinomonadaceae bacterium]
MFFVIAAAALLISSFVPRSDAQRQRPSGNAPAPDARTRRTTPATTAQQQTPKPAPTPIVPLPKVLINVGTPPEPPVDLSKPENKEIDKDATIKVDTNLVNLNVRVIDRLNRPINNVREEEFRVFENGVPQNIAYVSRQEVPISYGLVIDNSGSLRPQIEKVIEAGKFIVNSNKPGDETFLVRFIDKDHIETVQDFTSNKNALNDALEGMFIEGGQTAVKDAVYLSAEHVAEYKRGDDLDDRRRRALVLVTDGEDRSSFYKEDQLFARLREDDVQIFVIGFVKELDKDGGLIRKSPREKAVNLLERLAQETGGRVFFPESLSQLPEIADEITRDLRTQYRIGYSPTNKARDGSYRAVRVTVADTAGQDKRIAVTRPGYTAQREGSAAPAPTRSSSTRSLKN